MKKSLLLSMVITIVFAIGLKAQTASLTVTIDNDIQASAGPVEIPVYMEFIDASVEIGAFNLIIEFDENILSNPNATAGFVIGGAFFTGNPSPNQISIAWSHTTSLKDGDLTDDALLTLSFDAVSGVSDLDFVGKNTAVKGSAFFESTPGTDLIISTFNDGGITISSPVPLSYLSLFVIAGLFVVFFAVRGRRLF